ncbi:GTP-binding protein Era [hydrothermal vent metagenome]|uniref:GTP-binding protein Era n=1 Tax=hydrothermal vent metagenome TaxID=652676 RepID=A0A3B0ZZ16_9ZZZZ
MNTPTNEQDFHCGYVAIVGRPNVGKSTLLNCILGQKISITANRPQTTRHRILGVKTTDDCQVVYVDTPGLHLGGKKAINRFMNRAASGSITDVDVIIFVLDRTQWTDEDTHVLEKIKQVTVPVFLVVNKVDGLKEKDVLLPHLGMLAEKHAFTQMMPISAQTGEGVSQLEAAIEKLLPTAPPFFPEDQVTDRSERFMASEFVREKLVRSLSQELPYSTTVEIEKFSVENSVRHIHAIIWVERDGQKGIIIGKKGQQLKRIGELARKDMERAFEGKVFLQLWVKVRSGWADDERALRSLGYQDD